MTTDVMQLPFGHSLSAAKEQGPHLLQTRHVLRLDGDPFLDLTGEGFWDEGRPTRPYTLVFLLCMAAITLVHQAGDGLVGYALLEWLDLALDPCVVPVVLHLGVTLVGAGVAGRFSKSIPDPAVRRHMFLTLLAALGIGLILVWLGHLVGYTGARVWPFVVVYLLWAGAEAVSSAQI